MAFGLSANSILEYFYIYSRRTERIAMLPYCTEALGVLKGYRPAMDKLGPPVTITKVHTDPDGYYNVTDQSARFKMDVKGERRVGLVYVEASRKETDHMWRVDNLEISYRGHPGRYKIYETKTVTINN